jgi:hypothetical protein
MDKPILPHADYIAKQLDAGHREEAVKAHNARVKAEFERAEQGAVINLSDLMGAAEAFHVPRS